MKTKITALLMLVFIGATAQVNDTVSVSNLTRVIDSMPSQTYQIPPNDTIHVIYLLVDTSIVQKEDDGSRSIGPTRWMVEWQHGYVVLEHHNTLENFNPPVSKEDSKLYGRDYYNEIYLDYSRNRYLDRKYIVWSWRKFD